MHRVFEYRAPLRTASVGAIRNLLAAQIVKAGIVLDEERAYVLRLGSSELVDNATKHGGRERDSQDAELLIEGDVDHERRRLRITVTDPGVTVPRMLGCDDVSATGGRGLVVVAGYADDIDWCQRFDGGRPIGWSVWFELDVQELPLDFGQATAEAEVQPDAKVLAIPSRRSVGTSTYSRRRMTAWGRRVRGAKEHRAA
ncbi:ATP-binding protein [Kitasatospora sp. NPDC089509]|uniref:ATP-binding protein n=1 Tax=Kitasatospora sp. NPDC089509 TaxID=3364079 RepID=UPI00382FB4A5